MDKKELLTGDGVVDDNYNKIKKVIDFYVIANKLKYIKPYNSNKSYADHIFESMVLAVSINSEFSLTNNLEKVLRMLVLPDIAVVGDLVLNLEIFSKGRQYLKEIIEFESTDTPEAKLARYCKELDSKLNQLITANKYNELSLEVLYKMTISEGIFVPADEEEDKKYREIFRFYCLNQKLVNKERSGWDKTHWNIDSDRIERVSEHVYGTVILALILDSEFNFNINIDKVIGTLAIHEIGEVLIGDITPFDGIDLDKKKEMEKEAIVEIIGGLSNGSELIDAILEFDRQENNNAKFSYWCDKLEADIQSKIYQDMGFHHSLMEQQNNVVFNNSKIKEIIDSGAETAFDIWYEWDKNVYKESSVLTKLLEYIKDTRLI